MIADAAVQANRDAIYIPDHRSEFEPSSRWVRVKLGGVTIANSRRVMLLRETGRLPVYYFPRQDVRMDLLTPSGYTAHNPDRKSVV